MSDDVFALLRQRREQEYSRSDADLQKDAEAEREHQEHLARRRAKYAELREVINARRREHYANDPEAHARIRRENHECYESHKAYRVMKAGINSAKARERDPEGYMARRRGYSLKSKAKRMADPEKHEEIKATRRRYYQRHRDQICEAKRQKRREMKQKTVEMENLCRQSA